MNAKKLLAAAITASAFFVAPMANAVTFQFGTEFDEGTGYGTDASENTSVATLLDVLFTPSSVVQNFNLAAVGDFKTFTFGSVNFREPNGNSAIIARETDNLDLGAIFSFSSPFGVSKTVMASAGVETGSVSDNAVDYSITWSTKEFGFGDDGLFTIALSPLSFSNAGSKDLMATITLTRLETAAVPEPTTVALLGLGLLGFAASRRKAAKR